MSKAFCPFLNVHNTPDTAFEGKITSVPGDVEDAWNLENTDYLRFETQDGDFLVPANLVIFIV